jgi:predicted  nucleic acid-binding Zn-ribbon protein
MEIGSINPGRTRLHEAVHTYLEGISSGFGQRWAKTLASAHVRPDQFLLNLDLALRDLVARKIDVSIIQRVITMLANARPVVLLPASRQRSVVWHQARLYVEGMVHQQQIQAAERTLSLNSKLMGIGRSLVTALSIKDCVAILRSAMDSMGIASGYLVFFNGTVYPAPHSRVVFAYRDGVELSLPAEGMVFETRHLIPDELYTNHRTAQHIAIPLRFQSQELGYVLLEVNEVNCVTYELLADQISVAVRGSMLLDQLKDHSTQLDAGISELHNSAEELSINIDRIAESMQRQSVATAQGATAIEEMVHNIEQIRKISEQSDQLSEHLVAAVTNGKNHVNSLISSVRQVQSSSLAIMEIISFIQNIAEQTNVLSINASIQASKVGESGKGFMVIATEIRQLADSANTNIKQIESIIGGIRHQIDTSVQVASLTHGSLVAIESFSQQSTAMSDQLEQAITEQTIGSKEVLVATQELVNIADTVKEAVAQQKAATESINAALRRLMEIK